MSQSLNGCADILVVVARSTAAIDNFAIVNLSSRSCDERDLL